ncbi:MAG: molybdopterin-dependent oxidoreductase, partial [Methanomicrobium sp.]|nr:molybdopterin-dependent oxidoreductase [Methanomicrobium sp.]
DNVRSIAFIQTILGNIGKPGCGVNALRGQNNVQGSCDMGALPNVYAGYLKVTDPAAAKKVAEYWGVDEVPNGKLGLHIPEMLETLEEHPDKLKCLYLLGENPVISDPNSKAVEKSMENCEFLVVQDIFQTETSKYADVVLPGSCFAEEDGTQTNAERRVQRFRKAADAPGESKLDWEIIKMIAEKMGYGKYFTWETSEDVFNEMRKITPQYAGITYAKLDGDGIQCRARPRRARERQFSTSRNSRECPRAKHSLRQSSTVLRLRSLTATTRSGLLPVQQSGTGPAVR